MQCANQDTSASLLERSLETNLHMQVVNKLRNHHERMLRYVLNCSNTAGAQTQHAPDHLFPFGEEPAQGAGDHGIRSSHSHSRDTTSTPALLAQQHDKQLNRIHTNNLLTTWPCGGSAGQWSSQAVVTDGSMPMPASHRAVHITSADTGHLF